MISLEKKEEEMTINIEMKVEKGGEKSIYSIEIKGDPSFIIEGGIIEIKKIPTKKRCSSSIPFCFGFKGRDFSANEKRIILTDEEEKDVMVDMENRTVENTKDQK